MSQRSVKAAIVPFEKLKDDALYAAILSYPRPQKAELRKRLKELQMLGVTALEFSGDKHVFDVSVLGKGCVGIVLIAYVDKVKAALKVRRLDAGRTEMRHEAEMLEKANCVNVGPRLLGYTDNMLLMQFVDGSLLPQWLQAHSGKLRTRRVLHEILMQCWLLDGISLDHGELSHGPKHVIVDRADRPFIVDFETASIHRTPANLTSICHYLFIGGIAAEVATRIGQRDKKSMVHALRAYKKVRNRESFEEILEACAL